MKRYVCNSRMDVNPFDILESVFSNDDFFGLNTRVPACDIHETTTSYVIEAELPGITEEDIMLKLEKNHLTIEAKKKAETEKSDDKKYLRKERMDLVFTRTFTLPEYIDETNVNAVFKNGILTITVQKLPETSPKTIKINVA